MVRALLRDNSIAVVLKIALKKYIAIAGLLVLDNYFCFGVTISDRTLSITLI